MRESTHPLEQVTHDKVMGFREMLEDLEYSFNLLVDQRVHEWFPTLTSEQKQLLLQLVTPLLVNCSRATAACLWNTRKPFEMRPEQAGDRWKYELVDPNADPPVVLAQSNNRREIRELMDGLNMAITDTGAIHAPTRNIPRWAEQTVTLQPGSLKIE